MTDVADLTARRLAKARQTITDGKERTYRITGLPLGARVRTQPFVHPARFANKDGRVITHNLGEVGVSFNAANTVGAWFLPNELERQP